MSTRTGTIAALGADSLANYLLSLSLRPAIIYRSSKDAEDVAAELSKKWDAKIKAVRLTFSPRPLPLSLTA
jgi:sorbose reductase